MGSKSRQYSKQLRNKRMEESKRLKGVVEKLDLNLWVKVNEGELLLLKRIWGFDAFLVCNHINPKFMNIKWKN